MINKLIVEQYELRKKGNSLSSKILTLRNFINTAERIFIDNESKIAIEKIKKYLDDLTKELNIVHLRLKEVKDETNKNCKHEILCHNGYCAICGNIFSESEVNSECLIAEGHEVNTRSQINNIILDIAKRNGDISLEFEDIVFENYENILVRRKTR